MSLDPAASRNRLRVLDAVRRRGPIARVAIAQDLGLSRATVTAITADLIDERMVRAVEAPSPARERGRPRVLLDVDPRGAAAFALRVAPGRVEAARVDLAGGVDGLAARPLPPAASTEALVEAAAAALEEASARSGTPLDAASGIGVGLPGFVDARTGVCAWSPALREADAPVRARLAERLGRPVLLDNDAVLAALAELWHGPRRGEADLAVVVLEHGVGLGLVVDGRAQRRAGGGAPEFGHTKIAIDGAPCRCGQRGCLEAYVADYGLARDGRALLGAAFGAHDRPADEAVAALAARARAGDAEAAALWRRAGAILGVGLANLVNLIAPPTIVVAGAGLAAADLFFEEARRSLEANVVSASRGATRLEARVLDAAAYARGGGALVFEELLRPPD